MWVASRRGVLQEVVSLRHVPPTRAQGPNRASRALAEGARPGGSGEPFRSWRAELGCVDRQKNASGPSRFALYV